SPAAAPASAATAQPATSHVVFMLNSPLKAPGAFGDMARLQGELLLHPDAFRVDPNLIRTVDGQSYIWLRRVTDWGIAKFPHDQAAKVTTGVASAKQVEILQIAKPDHQNLNLCEAQANGSSNGDLSNRDIPDDCWVIIAPPAQ